jgi:hypothetical protein
LRSCPVPPTTTSISGLISSSQFLLLSLTNESPPQVGCESRLSDLSATWTRAFHTLQMAGAEKQIWSGLGETINHSCAKISSDFRSKNPQPFDQRAIWPLSHFPGFLSGTSAKKEVRVCKLSRMGRRQKGKRKLTDQVTPQVFQVR